MQESDEELREGFMANDIQLDGRFLVGVSSTGIYCRPICKAKTPKRDNCTFFITAAAAEQAGYRPCLLCRPELAPQVFQLTNNVHYQLAVMIEEGCGSELKFAEIATRLGIDEKELQDLFLKEFQVTPKQYLQTYRLLLAKRLFTDTDLPVFQIAKAIGFSSEDSLNELFKKQYHLKPMDLRKRLSKDKIGKEYFTLLLGYRPPYLWDELLAFLAGRAIKGVEKVKDGAYFRAVNLCDNKGEQVYGWFKVINKPKKNALEVDVSKSLLGVLPSILVRIRHLFDLYCDPYIIYDNLLKMNDLEDGLCRIGIRLPGCFEPFEAAVRAVLGQQISVKAASTLAGRVAQTFGLPLDTDIEELTHIFPTAETIFEQGEGVKNKIGELGVISTRAQTIYEIAKGIVDGSLDFSLAAKPENEINKLLKIRGIGSWTAGYIAMRLLQWPDSFLETDAGVRHALPGYKPKELLELAEAWRPWRSYATINLWNKL